MESHSQRCAHAFLNQDINNMALKREQTLLLARQEWQMSSSKAVPNSSFNISGQKKLECRSPLFILHLLSLPITSTIEGDYLLNLRLYVALSTALL